MIRKNIYEYYYFGTQLRYLQDVREGMPIHEEGMVLTNINNFLQNLESLQLNVTKRAARRLYELRDEFGKSSLESLSSGQALLLQMTMGEIRLTLDAEIQGLEAFITTDKRLSTEKLLGRMSSIFAPDVFDTFPDIAYFDFTEAGRCIAFELPTAAAFHILRGTEANLRYYYKCMIKQKRIKSEMWGPIVDDLRKKSKTKKYVTLNNHLDNIRVSFRNPTQHPEATYDIHEVQDLLSICVDVNNKMMKVLKEN